MSQTLKRLALIRLTPEQIDDIKQQTGAHYVPESVSFAVDAFAERKPINLSSGEDPDQASGLTYELHRI